MPQESPFVIADLAVIPSAFFSQLIVHPFPRRALISQRITVDLVKSLAIDWPIAWRGGSCDIF